MDVLGDDCWRNLSYSSRIDVMSCLLERDCSRNVGQGVVFRVDCLRYCKTSRRHQKIYKTKDSEMLFGTSSRNRCNTLRGYTTNPKPRGGPKQKTNNYFELGAGGLTVFVLFFFVSWYLLEVLKHFSP